MIDEEIFTVAELAATLLVVSLVISPLFYAATNYTPFITQEDLKHGVPPGSCLIVYSSSPLLYQGVYPAALNSSGGWMCLLLYNSSGVIHLEGC